MSQPAARPSSIVIVGGGHAAGQAVATLRQKDFDGQLTIIGNEPHLPYQRPPLSKQYLSGKLDLQHLLIRQQEFYESNDIRVLSNVTVTRLDPGKKQVDTDTGEAIRYDQLLLATGARPRMLDVPGIALDGIHYLRTIADVDRIRAQMADARSLCIVGGGYIGLEVAAVAVTAGLKVTVLEAADRVLQRVAAPQISDYYAQLHRSHGVEIREHALVSGFDGNGAVQSVRCGDERVAADLVIVGIGIEPNIELAAAAGLDCDDGIVVDAACRTSHADVFAAGDCTNHPNPVLQRRLRLESVPNALDQARVAAANMLGGDEIHDSVPWFWSDQYGLKLQMVGFAADGDTQVLRGDMQSNKFALFHLRDGCIVAVDAVNNPREFMTGKRLFGQPVDPAVLADDNADTRELLSGT